MTPELEARLTALADREEIADLVRRERFARDQMLYDVMRDAFHDGGTVRTSWYDGSTEAYTDATIANMAGSRSSKHWVFPGYIRVNGPRGIAQSAAMIFNRMLLEGTEVDFHVFCRFHSRVERRDGGPWKLTTFEVLWERDMMRCVDPSQPLPLDRAKLATYRPSYRHLAYVQETRGFKVNPNLYGDDRPEELEAFLAAEDAWLAGG